jgi:2,3-bisphosphoglycerate-independent phosphoglycerate mutase
MQSVTIGNWSLGFGTEMNETSKRPLALIILDGWGHSPKTDGNAIALAHTPNYDEICRKYPRTYLSAAGLRVGMKPDTAGSAEIGHLNIGAGRIVQADATRISNAIKSGEFFDNKVLKQVFENAKEKGAPVHLVGLLSDSDIHSSPEHLFALLRMAKKAGVKEVFIHGILDGRDVPARSADVYVDAIEIKMADVGIGEIATLCGRYFAMDETRQWERTARAYTMLVHAEGERSTDAVTAIRSSFLRGISDEFISPIVLERRDGEPIATVKSGDTVIFFNHRGDSMRQLVKSLAVADLNDESGLIKPVIDAVCLTEYDRSFGLPVAFSTEAEANVLTQIFAEKGISNSRLTEGERFAHLTYFLNGGVELELPFEQRVQVHVPKAMNFDAPPEMGSFKITDKLLRGLEAGQTEVFIVNLPAADLVARAGNIEKTIEAVQFVDTCLGAVLEKIREVDGIAIITSSHGNCEEMADLLTGKANPLPTANPVPFHYIDERANGLSLYDSGALEDVAPTILGILGIGKPAEMTGIDLRRA